MKLTSIIQLLKHTVYWSVHLDLYNYYLPVGLSVRLSIHIAYLCPSVVVGHARVGGGTTGESLPQQDAEAPDIT